MNLYFGGLLGNLMKPHMYKRISPMNLIRSQVRQNIMCKKYYYVQENLHYLLYRGRISFRSSIARNSVKIPDSIQRPQL